MTGVGCCGTWRWPPDVGDDNVISSADRVRPEPQPLGGLHRLRTLGEDLVGLGVVDE
jgi:hypothetical protein